MEKNLKQRLVIILVVLAAGALLIWPPSQKLRPGLDIAGGTSLIFEIDDTGVRDRPNLAEDVKQLLQRRVDPAGVYNLTWRVQGRNRIEVQMPLPPRDAAERRKAYATALDALFEMELRRGPIEEMLRLAGAEREPALVRLARGNADNARAALPAVDEVSGRTLIEKVVAEREAKLRSAVERYEQLVAARAAQDAGAAATQPGPSSPEEAQEALEVALRDASELFDDAVQEVLATNLNRRRFEEILDLDTNSATRKKSLAQILDAHADLRPQIEEVVARHAEFRKGKRFLDGPADLKRLLRGAGKLEFRILAEPDPANPTKFDRYREQLKENRLRRPQDDLGWFRIDNPMQFFNFDSPAQLEAFRHEQSGEWVVGRLENDYYVLAKIGPQDGLLHDVKGQRPWRLDRARIDRDEHGRWSVSFMLDPIGGQYFGTLTRNNIERPLCILVDDVAYSAPSIRSEIRQNGQITGEFSLEKVRYLVQTMEGGTLPARLKETPLSERTIGSSLGEVNRQSAVNAMVIATICVAVIMIGYYWVCGAVANAAMIFNVFLTLSAMAMLNARITLDGIAGLILAVGMAVDANVLIYERMREEKARGSSLRMVIKNGYDKAFRTIFDSNMTTLLTCVIIYYVGSEEIKGFGLMLGWGMVLNLFTSVFVTRSIFELLLRLNLLRDIRMMSLIPVPNIDWYGKFKYFAPASLIVIILGMALLFSRGTREVLDVEFLGGVAAEFELKQAGLNDVTISNALKAAAEDVKTDARKLDQVTVSAVPSEAAQFNVQLPGVSAKRLETLLTEPLESVNVLQKGGSQVQPDDATWTVRVQGDWTAEQLAARIRGFRDSVLQTIDNLGGASVNAVLEVGGVEQKGLIWNVQTTATDMRLVESTLTAAIGERMRIQPKTSYVLREQNNRPYPVTDRMLSAVVPGLPAAAAGVEADLTDYLGGVAIYVDQIRPPLSVPNFRERLDNMHFQPDFQNLPKRRFNVIGVTPADGATDERGNPLYAGMIVVTADPDIRYEDDPLAWESNLVREEVRLVTTALSSEQTLRKVMQFKPQVAAGSAQQAGLALILAWIMVIAYVWVRFGGLAYGVGGVIALVHDVLMAMVFVGVSGWIGGLNHPLGQALLLEDFKFNMPVIAALLTIIGFSINDTIVIYDRVRELRGRLAVVTPQVVNAAVNECMARTVLTTFTVLTVVLVAYIFGGSSIRGFSFTFLVGCLSGTYTTVVLAPAFLIYRLKRERRPELAPAMAT